jgi:hypothetical protein
MKSEPRASASGIHPARLFATPILTVAARTVRLRVPDFHFVSLAFLPLDTNLPASVVL